MKRLRWFNVFLLMLILVVSFSDKMGVLFHRMGACIMMRAGLWTEILCYFYNFPKALDYGLQNQVFLAVLGGICHLWCRCRDCNTVSKIIVNGLWAKEMALAMGLEMNRAYRKLLYNGTTVPIADYFGYTDESGRQFPYQYSDAYFVVSDYAVHRYYRLLYLYFYDKKLDALDAQEKNEEPFRTRMLCLLLLIRDSADCFIVCIVLFAVFPFIKYATDLMAGRSIT